MVPLYSTDMISYWSYCIRGRILHRFRNSLRHVQRRHIWLPSFNCVLALTEGFPWDDLRKILRGCQWVARLESGVETLRKKSTG